MSVLNNLNFIISLIDKVSAPMGKVMKSIDMASKGFEAGAKKISYGTAGVVGAAYSVNGLLEPTKAMQRALGEVKSLGVADDTLDKLRETALKFSTQYGETAADFVKASYDIQSAISGLSGDELSRFTEVSGVLAKGTKANVADITNYVGTMYGIFQRSADAMGKAEWIEKMAAQTAMAVNIFKSDGKQMSASFTAIGASAQNFGVSMAEQFAVLGKLQATMSGSEAGTKYKSFLDNVGKAQKVLNLQFTDAQGRMLPIVDILGKINQKFGDIDKVAEADLLKKAFGTDEAVALIKLLNNDLGGLKQNIADIGSQSGMDSINKMAEAMTDPWAKMKTGVENISTSIGTELLPVLLPMIGGVNDVVQRVLAWTHANPGLSKAIGIVTLTGFGFIGMLALFSIAAGYATIVSTGWGLAMTWIFNPIKNMAMAIWAALPSIWAFSAALLANPITWWVLGIAAVVGIVAAAVIYWDEWTAAVVDFGSRLMSVLGSAWGVVTGWWTNFKNWVSGIDPFYLLGQGIGLIVSGFEVIPQWWRNFKAWVVTLDLWSVIGEGIGLIMAGFEAIPLWWTNFKAWISTLDPWAILGESIGFIVAGFEAIPLWWSNFKAWIGTLDLWSVIGEGIGLIMAGFEAIPLWWTNFKAWISTLDPWAILGESIGFIVAGFEAIPLWWSNFKAWTGTLDPWAILRESIGLIVAGFEAIPRWWSNFKAWLAALNPFAGISSAIDSVMRGINSIKGARIPDMNIKGTATVAQNPVPTPPGANTRAIQPPPVIAPVKTGPSASVPKGGIMKQMSSVMNANKSTSIGEVNVHNYGPPMSGAKLRDELLFAGG
jgi:TP901 family phage tail tape measure protein